MDFGICLSAFCGTAEFDKCHYFPWFTVILLCTWKSPLLTVNCCPLGALNTQFIALWPSWALKMHWTWARTGQRQGDLPQGTELRWHCMKHSHWRLCRHWLTFRIIGSRVWNRGEETQGGPFSGRWSTLSAVLVRNAFLSSVMYISHFPWSIPLCCCSHLYYPHS